MPRYCIAVPMLRYEERFKNVLTSILNAVGDFDCEVIVGIQELNTITDSAESIFDTTIVKLLDSSKATTLSENLNNIIENTRSPYLVRMDDDDYMHPSRIRNLARTIEKYRNFAIIGQSYKAFSRDMKAGKVVEPFVKSEENKIRLLFGVPFAHPTITINLERMVRKKYDPMMKYAQDYMFYIDNILSGEFIGSGELSLYYRIPDQNKLNYLKKRQEQLKCHELAMLKLWKNILGVNVTREVIHELRCMYVTNEFSKLGELEKSRVEQLKDICYDATIKMREYVKRQ